MTIPDDFDKDWLSVAAHQLKTPIGAVQGFIQLIQQSGPLNERQQRFSDRAMAALDRMNSLLSALLEMSKVESALQMNLVDCDLRKVVALALDLVENLAEKRRIQIKADIAADIEPVSGDPHWLGQVMNNLLSNAIKYNREGGQIWVRVFPQGGMICVSVRDTGYGIRPEEAEHVFDKFFRSAGDSQVEGSGLGLAIARSIVLKHSGKIWVESVPGQGSTFVFTLPKRSQNNDGHAPPHEIAHAPGEGREDLSPSRPELATEEVDAVSDDLQEASGFAQADSSSDEV